MTESNPWVAASTHTGGTAVVDRAADEEQGNNGTVDAQVAVSVRDTDLPETPRAVVESVVSAWESAARAHVPSQTPSAEEPGDSGVRAPFSPPSTQTASAPNDVKEPVARPAVIVPKAAVSAPVTSLPQVRAAATTQSVAASGPAAPQPGVVTPTDGLPVRLTDATSSLWLVGAHGGSGESTLATLGEQWTAAGHAWPELPQGVTAPCVVVARTHVRGLLAARTALTQWAGSGAGRSVQLLGLVLVADAPGRLPGPLRDMARLVAGGAPRAWNVPWVEQWRVGETDLDGSPRSVKKTCERAVLTGRLDDRRV